jgi:predicted RNA-binding protein (virulence factor B family)
MYTGVLLSMLLAIPAFGFTSSSLAAPREKQATNQRVIGTMTGVVKAVDNTSIVLEMPKGKGPGDTLQLNQSTARKGTVAVGDTVEAHFYFDNGQRVATSLTVKATPKATGSK